MPNDIILIGPTESILTKRGNRFPNIADFLIEKGMSVQYLTSNFYHAEKRYFSKREIQEVKKILKYRIDVFKVLGYSSNVSPRRVFSNFFFSLRIFFFLLFRVKKGQKILLPSRPVELIFFMSLLKRIRKCEIYLDIQDIWPDALEINNARKKKIFTFYCNMFLRPSLKHYNGALHVAPSFQKWLSRYAKDNVRSTFVPLGWEDKRWNDFQKKKKELSEILNIVCVAQLQKQIDVMPILKVLAKNSKIHLTIIGEDGKGERYPEVKEFIELHGLKNVTIIGKVDRNELTGLLVDMNIGILPMISSSIPNKIFDYLAAFLPIVVLGDNDSSNFVIKNGIGWACDFDQHSLEQLIYSLDQKDYQEKLKNVEHTRRSYSRESLHGDILNVLVN